MPQIPDGRNRPAFDEAIIDLLESVALEEMALSHIINAEGEKLQEYIKKFGQNSIKACELKAASSQAHSILETTIMQQWLLISKLNKINEIADMQGLGCCVGRRNEADCSHGGR